MTEIAENRAGRDAAALDAEGADGGAGVLSNGMSVELVEEIEESLRDVVDPELGVNIVDLGLVYDMSLADNGLLTLDMTLTSAACPLTDMIEDQISAALLGPDSGGLVENFAINWVWLPPWGPERITDDGRDQLRALGFNI